MGVKKYRKKPVIVEAIQFTGDNGKEIQDWVNNEVWLSSIVSPFLSILTLEGEMKGTVGDYIIKGAQGEFYPCKPDIFEQTYEVIQ